MPETSKTVASEEKVIQGNDLEYLDIPAFLRKQAD
jgi:cell division protein FtsZ